MVVKGEQRDVEKRAPKPLKCLHAYVLKNKGNFCIGSWSSLKFCCLSVDFSADEWKYRFKLLSVMLLPTKKITYCTPARTLPAVLPLLPIPGLFQALAVLLGAFPRLCGSPPLRGKGNNPLSIADQVRRVGVMI